MKKLLLLVSLAVALTIAACSGGGGESSAGGTGEAASGGGSAGKSTVVQGAPVGAIEDQGATRSASSPASAVPQVGPQIIQDGSVRLSVARGRFHEVVDEARSIAESVGGFVVSSTASQGRERRLVQGTLVLRIPATSYGGALSRLERLGKVEALDESGQDVSKEFVDLRARVHQLQAVEAQLLELLDKANDVPAALAVQSHLADVQLDLEQARGRLQYLDDQVAFATISLSLYEAGLVPPKNSGGFGIVDAWATAGAAFLTVIGWMFVGLAVAAPILILLALGFLLGRALLRRLAQA
jgi:hypothetical protein